ncbi:MAG: hypothetical protein O7D34_08165 [Ignavibacteria bacterium]|nr:hypothetical protein [Ignavibacteria bacterium]
MDIPYRSGGWTVRQVVHHLADSHLNAFVRMKLILTEEKPSGRSCRIPQCPLGAHVQSSAGCTNVGFPCLKLYRNQAGTVQLSILRLAR